MGGGMSYALLNRAHPEDKKRTPGDYHREKGVCDNCNEFGNWWHIFDGVVCDTCLRLTPGKQRAIVRQHGQNGLYDLLKTKASEVFDGETTMALQVNISSGDVKSTREALRAKEGKLYLLENAYVNAAKRAKRLTSQASEAEQEAKTAKDKYESEQLTIEELRQKLIVLKIGG